VNVQKVSAYRDLLPSVLRQKLRQSIIVGDKLDPVYAGDFPGR